MPKRKCGTCGQDIVVDRHNLDNIAFYQNRYHHVKCLMDKANNGIQSGKRVANWEKLLNRIPELQLEAKKSLEHGVIRDEFNEYLLNHYDIISVPNRFWQIIEDIGNGNYRKNKCRPTDIDRIFQTWKWGQSNLDKIASNNKIKNKGPKNDDERLNYDLAIVLKHVPQYLAYEAKNKAVAAEIKNTSAFEDIDLSRIGQKKTEKKNDVSDIFDDFFS